MSNSFPTFLYLSLPFASWGNDRDTTLYTYYMRNFWKDLLIAIRGDEKEFTTGNIRRAIFLLSVPMIIEMFGEGLFAVVDMYFVNQYSSDAFAGVTLTESVMFLIYAIAFGVAMATTSMIARRIGEKDPEAAAKAAVQAIFVSLCLAVVICLIGAFFAVDILRLMGAEERVVELSSTYTRIMFMGNFTIMFLFLFNAVFRGTGEANLAMIALWVSNGLNIFLDPMLIHGYGPFPEMGATGAAVATNIGRGTGVCFQLFILLGGRSVIKLTKEHLILLWDVIKRLINVSLGGIGQFVIGSVSWMFLVRIVSEFGSDAVAGYGTAIRIIIFTILPSWGLANAAATLVGQNLGAKQPDRAEKSVWDASLFNMIFLFVVSLIFFIWANQVVGFFTQEAGVLPYGVMALRIICVGYVFYAYGMVIGQAFNGAGDTRTPTIINFIAFWLIQLPAAYLLAKPLGMGTTGVFTAVALSETALALIAIYWFRKGTWKTVEI